MMHCVYKVTFNERIKRNEPPFYYIGSCANFRFENGILYNKRNHIYTGSSSYHNYKNICKEDDPVIEILYIHDDYRHVLEKEREFQILHDSIKSELYFNLKLANEVFNYHELGTAIYRHKDTGKTIKLKTDDESVLNGTYIHIMKGTKMSDKSLLNKHNGYEKFKLNDTAYKAHRKKKSDNMKELWSDDEFKADRIQKCRDGFTDDVRNNISEKLKSYYTNLDDAGKLKVSNKIKTMHKNMDVVTKENRANKISDSLSNSEKFKSYTDSQKEKRKGGNNPSATHVYWDGLVFGTLIEFNEYIKENKLNKSKCHDIVKKNPTGERYIVKRSFKIK